MTTKPQIMSCPHKQVLDRIREHIGVLNHSSERMSDALDGVNDDLNELAQRVSSIEAHLGWLMRLVWVVLGGIIMIVFKVFEG